MSGLSPHRILTNIINDGNNTGLVETDSDLEFWDTGKSFRLSEFKFLLSKLGVAIPSLPPTSIPRIMLEIECNLLRGYTTVEVQVGENGGLGENKRRGGKGSGSKTVIGTSSFMLPRSLFCPSLLLRGVKRSKSLGSGNLKKESSFLLWSWKSLERNGFILSFQELSGSGASCQENLRAEDKPTIRALD